MITEEQLDTWAPKIWEKLGASKEHYLYANFIKNLHGRMQLDKHSVVLVSGEAGEGKSNFAAISGILLRLHGFDFSFSNHFSYGDDNLDKVVETMTASKRGVFVFDEGIEVGDSRRFMSKVNGIISRNLTRVRKNNHIFFWNIPDIVDLDARIKHRIANFWVHVIYRTNHIDRSSDYSMAALFRKDRNPANRDKWGFDTMEKTYRHKPIHSREELMRAFSRVHSFVGFMKTPRLPKGIEDSYRGESERALAKSGRKGAEQLSKQE